MTTGTVIIEPVADADPVAEVDDLIGQVMFLNSFVVFNVELIRLLIFFIGFKANLRISSNFRHCF